MREKIIELLYDENVRSDCGVERLADEICAIGLTNWVPVSEGLPVDCVECLVTTKDVTGYSFVKTCFYGEAEDINGFYDYDPDYGFWEVDNVVAWMPLSAPYKGEEDV